MRIIALLLFAISFLPLNATGNPLYGVSTHFAQNKTNPETLSKLQDTGGFNSLRDEIYWHDVEKKKGIFELTGKAKLSADMINMAAAHGMNPIVVLDYGNPNYDGGSQPHTDEGRAAYGRYCKWIASQLADEVRLFEIWNEWNHGMGTVPPRNYGSATDYVKLTKVCAQEIRRVRPSAIIIGGAVTNDWGDWPWLDQAMKEGLLAHVDAVSVHIYSFLIQNPNKQERFIEERILKLTQLLQKHGEKDIYITEVGWPNHSGPGGNTKDISQSYLTRFILLSQQIHQIKGIWFYELKDSGLNQNDKEHNFGLLDFHGNPKPAYCSLASTISSTSGKTFTDRAIWAGLVARTYFSNEAEQVTALWMKEWPVDGKGQRLIIQSELGFELISQQCKKPNTKIPKQLEVEVGAQPVLIKHSKPLIFNKK